MVSKKVKSKIRSSIKSSKKTSYFLEKGDVIAVVAPASAPPADVLIKAKAWIEKSGYKAQVPDDLLSPEIFISNSDEYRLNHLKTVLLDPQVKMIWCIRGGYGCSRLIPELLKVKKQKEKLFIGISDITTLHLFLTQKWGWKTVHGPLLDRLAENKLTGKNELELMQALSGEKAEFVFEQLTAMNQAASKTKKIQAILIGGNLTVLSSNSGTGIDHITKKHILFLEDLGERGYRIDRMLQQIKQNKSFKNCQAIVLGDFLGGDEPNKENHVQVTLKKFAETLKIPVFAGIPCGHGEVQRPLFFNTKALLFSGANPKLTVYNK